MVNSSSSNATGDDGARVSVDIIPHSYGMTRRAKLETLHTNRTWPGQARGGTRCTHLPGKWKENNGASVRRQRNEFRPPGVNTQHISNDSQ